MGDVGTEGDNGDEEKGMSGEVDLGCSGIDAGDGGSDGGMGVSLAWEDDLESFVLGDGE